MNEKSIGFGSRRQIGVRQMLWAVLLVVTWAPATLSATAIVAPGLYSDTEAPERIIFPFQAEATTYQWVFPGSEFTSVAPGSLMTSIGFRVDAGLGPNIVPFEYATWNLTLGTAAASFPALIESFAANFADDAMLVRSGPLTIPTGALQGGPGVNPFYHIAFDTPFLYTGGDLVMLLTHTGSGFGRSRFVDGEGVYTGLGNTVFAREFDAGAGEVGFVNFPVTEFLFERMPVSEPASLALLLLGVSGLFGVRRRTR